MPKSRQDFIRMPLNERRHKVTRSLVKTVHATEGTFLSEWAFEDIALEPWGVVSARPMVYMRESDEAVEKSMWCYEHGMVPLIADRDPDIAAFTALHYNIDSLILDAASLQSFLPYLESRLELLQCITLIEPFFTEQILKLPLLQFAKRVRLLLALPETGAFAEAEFGAQPSFALLPGCRLEAGPSPRLTKSAALVTPIVDYQLPAELSKVSV